MKSRRIIRWSMKNLVNTIHRTLDNKFDFFLVVEGKRGLGKTQKKGSKVLMSDGSWKNIEDIKIGDEVVSPQKNGEISFEKVTETHNRFEEDMYDVIEKNRQNKTLYTVAGNHDLVISTRKWKELPKENGKRKRKKERVIKEIEARDLAKQKLLKSGNSTIYSLKLDSKMTNNPRMIAIDLKKAKPDWVYGFSITGKSKWYVTDNWMITHNSTMAVLFILQEQFQENLKNKEEMIIGLNGIHHYYILKKKQKTSCINGKQQELPTS